MKKVTFLFATLIIPVVSLADPWMDDWIDQMTVSNPGYLEGQRRGYFSAGGFQARWRMQNDYLLTVNTPKIRSGCGGIDMFLGGMSFLDPDLIVDKFQRIIQAAPAVAFDMALKTMCKECSDTMTKMERAASWLNNLQMNECAMSKRLVATVQSDDPDIAGEMWGSITGDVSLSDAVNRNYNEVQDEAGANNDRADPAVPMGQALADCPAEFRNVFTNGSVLQNVAANVGIGPYADLLRGFVGDVMVNFDAANNAWTMNREEKCRRNDEFSIEDMLEGQAQEKTIAGVCQANTNTNMYIWMRDQLQGIADSIGAGGNYTPQQLTFIDSAPLPVLQIMNTAVQSNNTNATITVFNEPLAVAYTYRAMDDLYSAMLYAIRIAGKQIKKANETETVGGSSDRCQAYLVREATEFANDLANELRDFRKSIRRTYQAKIGLLQSNLAVARSEQQKQEEIRKAQLRDVKATH